MAIVEKWSLYGWWYKSDYCLEQKGDWCREGAFNRDSTIFDNFCDVRNTTMLYVVLFQTCLMTCMDIQLRIMIWLCHQQLVRSLVLYVMFDFSFIITCIKNALAFNIIF